jgi:prolyl oligopeptidase
MGGVYAVATLRGGSEYGESWHRDGMLLNKQHVFDDFISAAEWLIDSGYTTPDRLAIQGGSNGGLLVASAFTQRPELFRAVVCTVPDIDILRFFKYTRNNNAPAMLEYGSSEHRDQFEAIRAFSPYQNVREGTDYPAVMFATGDLDTRVPPLAARKTTARMQAATTSGLPVILRYHPKRGHAAGGGLPMSRRIVDTAMQLTFLLQQLGVEWPSE